MKLRVKAVVEVKVTDLADATETASKIKGVLEEQGTITDWSEKVLYK